MKRILILIGICMYAGVAAAGCPTTANSYINFEEVHMDNFVLTDAGESCPTGTAEYFDINEMCDSHIW